MPSRRARRSSCSRRADPGSADGSGRSGPDQARTSPCRSSIATRRPVSSCSAAAMPGSPSPRIATSRSRWWMRSRRSRSATVAESVSLVSRSAADDERALARVRAPVSAVPACWASASSRYRVSTGSGSSPTTTRWPRAASSGNRNAQLQGSSPTSTAPEVFPRAASCDPTAAVVIGPPSAAPVTFQPSPSMCTPPRRQDPTSSTVEAVSATIRSSSSVSVITCRTATNALRLDSCSSTGGPTVAPCSNRWCTTGGQPTRRGRSLLPGRGVRPKRTTSERCSVLVDRLARRVVAADSRWATDRRSPRTVGAR